MIVGHLERVQDRQAGWKVRRAKGSNRGRQTLQNLPQGKGVGRSGSEKDPWGRGRGHLTEVFNGLDEIVAQVEGIQLLQRL